MVKKKFSFSPPDPPLFLKKENLRLFTNMKVMSQTNCTINALKSRKFDPWNKLNLRSENLISKYLQIY